MKRLNRFLMIMALLIGVAGAGAAIWNYSSPVGCEIGRDPALALANERAGEKVPYREWCHEFGVNKLHVVEAGEGDVVLFLHGFPSSWYSMIRPMEALRDTHRVVAIDGLGAGHSDAPAGQEQYRLENMALHLDALIDKLGVEKVHIVGHDWGSAFGLAYAQSRPERILTATGMSAPPQNIAVELLRTSSEQREKSAYVEMLKDASPILMWASGAGGRIATGPENHFKAGRMSRVEADVLQNAASDLRRINRHINWYRANLPAPDEVSEDDYWPSRDARFEVPTLLIWGEDDTVFDPQFIDLTRKISDDFSVVRLDGVGHAPQFEATEAVNTALADHILGELEADASPQ